MNKYDSPEEEWFSWYVDELARFGLVKKCEHHPKPFILSESTKIKVKKKLKTKTNIIERLFINGHVYTCDFKITWNENGFKFFDMVKFYDLNKHECYGDVDRLSNTFWCYDENGEHISYFEIKPGFDRFNMTREFTINQKWVYNKYGIYVQLIKPKKLFEDTFTPTNYLLTKTGRQKDIKWKVKTINEFLN